MKFTIETNDELEAQLLTKAKDYHFAIWDFVQYLRKQIKYDEESSSEIIKEREQIQKDFFDLLEEYKIDINLLP